MNAFWLEHFVLFTLRSSVGFADWLAFVSISSMESVTKGDVDTLANEVIGDNSTNPLKRHRGGVHRNDAQSKVDVASALSAAIADNGNNVAQEVSFVSRCTIAVHVATDRICSKQLIDELAYNKSLSACMGLQPESVRTKERRYEVSFMYSFSSELDCFKRMAAEDWERVVGAMALYNSTDVGCSTCFSNVKAELLDGVVRFKCETPRLAIARALKVAGCTEDVVDIIMNGARCNTCSCSRRTGRSYHASCCHKCVKTNGDEHTHDCDDRAGRAAGPSRRRTVVSLHADASQLQLAQAPYLAVLMESQAESSKALAEITRVHEQDIATAVGAVDARVLQQTEHVSTVGQFTCKAFGSERVGCFLCSTKSMIKWCWYDHALTKRHLAAVENHKIDAARKEHSAAVESLEAKPNVFFSPKRKRSESEGPGQREHAEAYYREYLESLTETELESWFA